MAENQADVIRDAVRDNYAAVAKRDGAGGCCSGASCCNGEAEIIQVDSLKLGYSADDLAATPAGANLGLGCGNPQAIAALQPGEVVLDLGSGGGFDCFLAAQRVGPTGRVIGVDMTPDMISKARQNAEIGSYTNVEFRLGEIEALPVADNTADVIISNCVINLSPEKPRVFREAFRALKPGGRLAISDVVAAANLPEEIRRDLALHCGCIAGASSIPALEQMLREAGFVHISIQPHEDSREFIREWAPGRGVEAYIVSAAITAQKPVEG
jgi:SAM-dependent methyltransferase